jgi:hypothetical protein
MNASRLKNIAIRTTMLGALLASTAGVAVAQQKAKQQGPPVTTKGTVKSNPKADKGQATAEAARANAREEKAEKSALSAARGEPKSLLKGIKMTEAEKKATGDIEKRYADQFKDLKKSDKAADKAGTPDAAYLAKIDALRLQERAELRAALTPEQQLQYDKNIATLGAKKS